MFLAGLGGTTPAGAATESFTLSSASLAGESSVQWQSPPATTLPDPVTLGGQIDSASGAISAATLTIPPINETQEGENVTFAFSEVHPGTATGTYNASSGAVTLQDALSLTFSVPAIPIVCVSTPITVAFSGTYDSSTENVTLSASDFTIPQFPASSGTSCGLAASSLNANPGGVAGSTGNAFSIALHGQFAPGLATTTTLSANPPSPQLAGSSVTLTADVAGPAGSGTPTGSVTFLSNGASVGTATMTGGAATLTTADLPGGTDQLAAAYSGDTTFAASTSAPVSYVLNPAPTMSANLPASASQGGAPAAFSITVANPALGLTYDHNLQINLSLTGGGVTPDLVTMATEDSSGASCPIALTGNGTVQGDFLGVPPAPCGTAGGFSLAPGESDTFNFTVAFTSAMPPAQMGLTATLQTLSGGSVAPPLSGTAAPVASGDFLVTLPTRYTPVATTTLANNDVPSGFVLQASTTIPKPLTPTGLPYPTGTLTYSFDDGPAVSTATFQPPTQSASLSTQGLAPGTHTLVMNYSGDSTYTPATTTTTFSVLPAPPGVLFACDMTGFGVGPFAATLEVQTDPIPPGVPSGSTYQMTGIDVTMNVDAGSGFVDPTGLGEAVPITAGLSNGQSATSPDQEPAFTQNGDVYSGTLSGLVASIPITGQPGSSVDTAITSLSFSFDLGFGLTLGYQCNAISGTEGLPLPPVPVSGTTLSISPASPVGPGTVVTLTATTFPTSQSAAQAGSVEFFDGTTSLGVVPVNTTTGPTLGTAVLLIGNLAGGEHQLSAVWSGNLSVPANASNTVDLAVGNPSTTTLTSSANPANAAHPVTFTATVTPPDGATTQPTGTVAFSVDGQAVSTCQDQALSMADPPTATCTLSFAAGASHVVVATYSGDDQYLSSASDPLTQTVLPGTTSTLTTKANPAPPGRVTFWDGVKASSGGPVPAGTVAFTVDGSAYKACSTQPLGPGGGASCALSFKAGTTHKVYATYPGSASYSGSVSNTITLQVNSTGSSTVPKATGGSATLPAGKSLSPGQRLTAGSYRLVMQPDGNLVEYQGSKALWASHTAGHPGTGVVMQRDGNLVEYDHGKAIWASNTAGHPGAHLTLQGSDGNVVIYTSANRAVWATGT